MRFRPTLLLIAFGLAAGSLGSRSASAQVLDPIQYTLADGSDLEYGCFGPCACPIFSSGPMKGQFTFYRTGIDPLYTHYALLDIAWSYTVNDGPGGTPRVAQVRGSGTYDLGGEVALMQRMTLDVTTDGTLQQHFDSGLVPVRAAFPVIAIDARLHVNACVDSVFQVVASPFGLASVDPGRGAPLLTSLAANPARGDVRVLLATRSAGRARVDVVDVRGRVVTTLLDGALAPGVLPLRWDGRDGRGTRAGPGVYWIRAEADGRMDRARIVRLD